MLSTRCLHNLFFPFLFSRCQKSAIREWLSRRGFMHHTTLARGWKKLDYGLDHQFSESWPAPEHNSTESCHLWGVQPFSITAQLKDLAHFLVQIRSANVPQHLILGVCAVGKKRRSDHHRSMQWLFRCKVLHYKFLLIKWTATETWTSAAWRVYT